jgi:hypothetical protein
LLGGGPQAAVAWVADWCCAGAVECFFFVRLSDEACIEITVFIPFYKITTVYPAIPQDASKSSARSAMVGFCFWRSSLGNDEHWPEGRIIGLLFFLMYRQNI